MKLNCDLGESCENWYNGKDQKLLQLVDMANISCGVHAGDEMLIKETLSVAIGCGKKIGAHPSYPDRENFGRKSLSLSTQELYTSIYSQLSGFLKLANGKVDYVKPHGALYHDCMTNKEVLVALQKAMKELGLQVPVMLLAGFKSEIPIIPEAFLDRRYQNDSTLVSRSSVGSMISDPKEVLEQYIQITEHCSIIGIDGKTYEIHAESLCIHSDTLNALSIAEEIIKYKQNKAY